eukprot:430925_1
MSREHNTKITTSKKRSYNFNKKRKNSNSTDRELSFWKYNNNSRQYSTRLIERGSGSHPNVIIRGHIHSYLYLYHSIIDTPWIKLFFYGFLLFFLFNLFFGTIFHLINGVTWNGEPNKPVSWSDAFFFALQSMDTIGFGALIPTGNGGNWLVFIMSYMSGIFWTAFTGIVFAKLSRPSRLKRQFKFSDVAVISHNMECFIPEFFDDPQDDDDDNKHTTEELEGLRWSEYGEYGIDENYPCLQFRYGDMRHTSRICDSDFHLLFFSRATRHDEDNIWEDYIMEEMDFDINRQKGRLRSLGTSVPLLSLPWNVVHKIDKLSPLYGLSKTDMINRKCEIIAIVDGIDEATSDNFQSWWSYTANEIYWNYKFKPMVKAVVKSDKQFLQIDYDRISLIRPISKSNVDLKMSLDSNKTVKKRKGKGSKITKIK